MLGKAVEIDITSERYRKGSQEDKQQKLHAVEQNKHQIQNQEQEHENSASR